MLVVSTLCPVLMSLCPSVILTLSSFSAAWVSTKTQGIQVMGLSYGVIMVIFLGALVPAVANRNFQNQSKEK